MKNLTKSDSEFRLSSPWRKKVFDLFLKHCFTNKSQINVIDVGCSDGEVPIAVASLSSSITVTGIDTRRDELDIAKERAKMICANNASFVDGYFYQEYKREAYDVVTFSEVYEHLVAENQILALRVIGRMLKNNGYLVMTCPNGDYVRSPLERHQNFDARYPSDFFKDPKQTDHWLEPTKKELHRLLVSLGYDVIESAYFNLPFLHRTEVGTLISSSRIEPILNRGILKFIAKYFCKNIYVVARKNSRSPLLDDFPIAS